MKRTQPWRDTAIPRRPLLWLAAALLFTLPPMFGKKNAPLTEQDVLAALKGVKDPDIQRDLVDLGMVKDIERVQARLSEPNL